MGYLQIALLILAILPKPTFATKQLELVAARPAADEIFENDLDVFEGSNMLHGVEHGVSLANHAPTKMLQPVEELTCSRPGFTGQFCEFPICQFTNNFLPPAPNPYVELTIDAALIENCTIPVPTLIDSGVLEIIITVTSFLINTQPTFRLLNSSGGLVEPYRVEPSASAYTAAYIYDRPGDYLVVPTAIVATTQCLVRINECNDPLLQALSTFDIAAGWVHTDRQRDPERVDYPNPFAYVEQVQTLIATPLGLRFPATINTVTIANAETALVVGQRFQPRYGCNYPYYYHQFYCPATGNYWYHIHGYDFYGNPFRRLFEFACILPPPTTTVLTTPGATTPTPDPSGPISCRNGGVLITNPDGTRFCYCRGLFRGPDCGTNICMNGGTPINGLTCICPGDGSFYGNHCEHVRCLEQTNPSFRADRPTLSFVVRVGSQMNSVVQQVADAVANITSRVQGFDPDYLSSFALVLYNNNNLVLQRTYTNHQQMINDLQAAAASTDTSGGCSDSTFSALAPMLTTFDLTPKSPIYVISDALPNDNDIAGTVFDFNSYQKLPIYFVYIEPAANSSCASDIFDPGYRAMREIAERFSGGAFFVPNTQTNRVYSLIFEHWRYTQYRTALVFTNDPTSCNNQPTYQAIQVDSQVHQIVVVASGVNLQLAATNPEGSFPDAPLVFQLNDTYIWFINGPALGQWLLKVVSTTPTTACSYRFYAGNFFGSQAGRLIDFDFFWALSLGLGQDARFFQPIQDVPLNFIGQMTNYPNIAPERVSAELSIYSNRDGSRQIAYAANGIWRDGCAYKFYFPDFTCRRDGEQLYYSVFVRDSVGFFIQRGGSLTCVAFHPTTTPPEDCQNGGVFANVTGVDGNTTTVCLCPPLFNGTRCQNRICLNGGTPLGFGRCQCPPGQTGDSCEINYCIRQNNATNLDAHSRQMVFAVELTANSVGMVNALNNLISPMLSEIRLQHPNWINRFYLVGYNSTWSGILANVSAFNAFQISSILNQTYANLQANPDPGCTVQYWQALSLVYPSLGLDPFVFVFHTGIPDEAPSSIPALTTAFGSIVEKRILMNVFFGRSPVGGSFVCNSTFQQYQFLYDAVSVSTGNAFNIIIANTASALRIIPNYYMNALVYERYFPNCTMGQDVYFPIDSYSQTLQMHVFGNADYTLFSSNGQPYNVNNTDVIVRDTVTGLTIVEARKPCPDGWEDMGGRYCGYFVFRQMTWEQGHDYCHDADPNGFLADELFPAKNDYLNQASGGFNFWIGLNRIMSDDWVWDRPGDVNPQPLNETVYSNWRPGEPSTNMSLKCVVRRQDGLSTGGGWVVTDCDQQFPILCQRHRYDIDFPPTTLTDDVLPAGKWRVSVKKSVTDDNASCGVQIRVQSTIQVYAGYTLDLHGDDPMNGPISDNTQNRFITHLSGVDAALTPGFLSYAHLFTRSLSVMAASVTYEKRQYCSYPWLSQDWACFNAQDPLNQFIVIHVGEDQHGVNFQRMTHGHCFNGMQLNCQNGGIMYNGTCVCGPYWTGTTCTTPVCVNGGTSTGDACVCPSGYGGYACQLPICLPQVPQVFTQDGRTLVLAIDLTVQNQDAITLLRGSLVQFLTAVQNAQPTWITNFVVVTFDSTRFLFSGSAPDIPTFANIFNGATEQVTDNPTDCGRPLWGALISASGNNAVRSGSNVWVITAGIATDYANQPGAMELLSTTGSSFNYLYVSGNQVPCGLDITSPNITAYTNLAVHSGGFAFYPLAANFDSFLSLYQPTLYNSVILFTNNFSPICNGSNWYIQIDSYMVNIYITIYAEFPAVSVTDPMGNNIPATMTYNGIRQRFYTLQEHTLSGIYTVSVNAPSSCSVQIRGTTRVQVYSAYTQPIANNGINQDNAYVDPVINVPNIFLAHIEGPTSFSRLLYAEIFATNTPTVLRLYRRANCSYEYYSDPFTCPSSAFTIAIHGFDDNVQNFRRLTYAICVNSRPSQNVTTTTTIATTTTTPAGGTTTTTTPGTGTTTTTTPGTGTTTTTLPGSTSMTYASLAVDLVIAVDSSVTMNSDAFLEVKAFIKTLMAPFNVGRAGTRISLFALGGDDQFPGPLCFLNTITSQTMLASYVDSMIYDGTPGQPLKTVLEDVGGDNFRAEGYRSEIVNHVFLYITGTSTFTDGDAVSVAVQLRQARTYGFMVITYRAPTVDQAPFMTMTGGVAGCTFIANDNNALSTTVATSVREKIFGAYMDGVYCSVT